MADPTSPDHPEAEPTQPIEPVTADAQPSDLTAPGAPETPEAQIPSSPQAPAAPEGPETFPAVEPTQTLPAQPPGVPVAPVAPAAAGPQPAIIPPAPRGPRFVGARRLWGEATASSGARVATIVALALATIVVIGGVTAAAVAVSRHGDDGRGQVRMGQPVGPGNGKRLGPQGQGNGQGKEPRGPFAPKVPGGGRGQPGFGGPLSGGAIGPGQAGSLHGEFTEGQPATAYLFQRWTVTASSATSLAVKSTDGFTATYAVSDSTQVRGARAAQVTVGSEVMVVATKQGSAAVRIVVIPAGAGMLPNTSNLSGFQGDAGTT